MSTIYWKGGALPSVAQVSRSTFAGFDSGNTTRKITIGTTTVSVVDATDLATTLTALATAANASTDFYFTKITWSSDATHLIGTSDTAGVGIIFAGSVSGGTGTCSSAFNTTTNNAGPNDVNTAANYSGGVLPTNSDTLILENNSVSMAYSLDALSAITLAQLRIDKTYTGLIGLPLATYATSVDGTSPDSTNVEVRAQYLKIGATLCNIGQNFSGQTQTGSGRLKIDLTTVATTCTIYDSSSTSNDANFPPVQLLCNANTSLIYVRSGSVGLAVGPGETSTVNKVFVIGGSYVGGPGVTYSTSISNEGGNILSSYTALGTVYTYAGSTTINGTAALTGIQCLGGTLYYNSSGSGGAVVLNNGGVLSIAQSGILFTIGTFAPVDGTLILNPAGISDGGSNNFTFPSPSRIVFSRS